MPAITTIRLRRGTAAQWSSANPVLAAGEMGIETDTRKFKFGNGSTQWNSIPYASAGGSTGGGFFVSETEPVGPNIGDVWYCTSDTGELGGKSFIRYDGYWVEINPGILGPKGDDGADGAPGAPGAPGADGADGDPGIAVQTDAPANTDILWLDSDDPASAIPVPAGGTTGQVLAKASGDDYDSEWVTKADIPLSTVTTAGDLIVADGNASVTRLGIGTNGQVLQSDGTTATWVTPAGGGSMTLLSTTSLSGSSVTVSGINQSYKMLVIVGKRIILNTLDDIRLQIGTGTTYWGAAGALNYSFGGFANSSTNKVADGTSSGAGTSFYLQIFDYQSTNSRVPIHGAVNGGNDEDTYAVTGLKFTMEAISQITLSLFSATFSSGTIEIYGVN